MKILLALLIATAAQAVPKLEAQIICDYVPKSNTRIENFVYREGKDFVYTITKIVRYTGNKGKVLTSYALIYDHDQSSLFQVYENKDERVKLTVSNDDMGGMSTWKIKGKEYPLTCVIEAVE